jgi:proteasome lid subunit RPN8/RPN11
MKLIIDQEYMEIMRKCLEKSYPHEACGFISGNESDQQREVNDLWAVDNKSADNLRRRFVIDPLDYLQAERKAEEKQTKLLGLFHSHPDHPAYPSEHDLVAAQPYFSYVIASVHDGKLDEIRSFRLENGKFIEEEIIVKS